MLSQTRFMVLAILNKINEAEFGHLKNESAATSGNLSLQLQRLKQVGYVEISKKFKGNYPLTLVNITPVGKMAFKQFVDTVNSFASL